MLRREGEAGKGEAERRRKASDESVKPNARVKRLDLCIFREAWNRDSSSTRLGSNGVCVCVSDVVCMCVHFASICHVKK